MVRLTQSLAVVLMLAGCAFAQTYSERVDLAHAHEFQKRVSFAITKTALDVMGQGRDPTDESDRLRVALAQRVLRNTHQAAQRFAMAVVTDLSINDASTDAELQQRVVEVWDAVAGVSKPATASGKEMNREPR